MISQSNRNVPVPKRVTQSMPAPERRGATLIQVDTDRTFLEAMAAAQGQFNELEFLGWAVGVEAALDSIDRIVPDILLISGQCFVSGFRELIQIRPLRQGQSRLAIFADALSGSHLEHAQSFPDASFLSRRCALSELAAHLRGIAAGERRIAPELALRLNRHGKLVAERRNALNTLSERQRELVVRIARGERVRDISSALGMTDKAVESHKYRLMSQLGIHDRVELCRWAIREGLIDP
jgi:DNA-binding NarL/FixJ family response regulator